MRIAVYHNLPSGGAKRALYEIVRRLAKNHQVDAFSLSTADQEFCDLRPYCRSHVVASFSPLPLARPPLGRFNQGIRTLDLLRLQRVQTNLAQRINAQGYDVVFVHHCRYGKSPSLLRYLDAPSIYFCHEPPRLLYEPQVERPYNHLTRTQRATNLLDPFPGMFRRTLYRLDRANVLAADRVLVNSAYSRESLYRVYGIFAHVAYLGVDVAHFRPLGLPKSGNLLSVGALNPRKGFDFLIASLGQVSSQHRPRLKIVSNFGLEEEQVYLDGLARDNGVEVSFLRMVEEEELVQLYNQAELVLYAPIMEPFGFVPLEAMACGVPVVGVREAGIRESIIHAKTGLLIDRDTTAFAEAIENLLIDHHFREQLATEARSHVERQWRWDTSVCRIERQLRSLAS